MRPRLSGSLIYRIGRAYDFGEPDRLGHASRTSPTPISAIRKVSPLDLGPILAACCLLPGRPPVRWRLETVATGGFRKAQRVLLPR